MYIKSIKLNNFRNYASEDVEFNKKLNIFSGNNAQGKTNLIESIYLSSFGKSFRTNKDSELIKFDEQTCKVSSVIVRERDDINIDFILSRDGHKIIKINELPIKSHSDLMRSVYIVIFSPEDLKIVKDSPDKRRRFIDKELSSIRPSYYKDLYDYKKILKQRNTYLREENIDKNMLYVWDSQLIEIGSKIIQKRKEFIEKLNVISKKIHKNITFGKENLDIIYDSNIDIANSIEEQIIIYEEKIESLFNHDVANRTTSAGPHKDDIKIIINGVNARNYGSQGQQRTAALSLKLAELELIKEETDENAILLLDDVLSELDYERQQYLINYLGEIQVFITSAEISDAVIGNFPDGFEFEISEGSVRKK